jgi:hypothetical protein
MELTTSTRDVGHRYEKILQDDLRAVICEPPAFAICFAASTRFGDSLIVCIPLSVNLSNVTYVGIVVLLLAPGHRGPPEGGHDVRVPTRAAMKRGRDRSCTGARAIMEREST